MHSAHLLLHVICHLLLVEKGIPMGSPLPTFQHGSDINRGCLALLLSCILRLQGYIGSCKNRQIVKKMHKNKSLYYIPLCKDIQFWNALIWTNCQLNWYQRFYNREHTAWCNAPNNLISYAMSTAVSGGFYNHDHLSSLWNESGSASLSWHAPLIWH